MNGKRLLSSGAILLVLLMIGTALAQPQEWGKQTRRGAGRVTSVTLSSNTIVVEIPVDNRDSLTVGAEVTDETEILSQGEPITLGDIQVGDKVVIKWTRLEDKLVANSIIVRSPR